MKRFHSITMIVTCLVTAPQLFAQHGKDFIEPKLVVAQHVLLLEGRKIITWSDLDEIIRISPDPKQFRPKFNFTHGAMTSGAEEFAQARITELRTKHGMRGLSISSMSVHSSRRFDRVRDQNDLVPNSDWKQTGNIVDLSGNAVAGAELILVSADAEMDYHIYLEGGLTRNELDHEIAYSDQDGRFAVHPEPNTKFRLVALHRDAGFAVIDSDRFQSQTKITTMQWAKLTVTLADERGEVQTPHISSHVPRDGQLPQISVSTYLASDSMAFGDVTREFNCVPPIYESYISRSFESGQGVSHSLSGASVSLLPGDDRTIKLGPLSPKQRKQLADLRKAFR